MLWPDSDGHQGQRSLNTEVWRLRIMLKATALDPDEFLHSDQDSVGFRPDSDHWLDVAEFDRLTRVLGARDELRTYAQSAPGLGKAVALHRGELAEDVLDDWCLVPREAYRDRVLAALEVLLTKAMEERLWENAISHASRLLEIDPLQEHVHRALMRCHYILGNRPAALRQFTKCERALREELQIEPMQETRHLYLAVARGDAPLANLDDAQCAKTARNPLARERIDLALSTLSTVQAWLQHANQEL
jgi:DNA-binding SARP family transcriptional activator